MDFLDSSSTLLDPRRRAVPRIAGPSLGMEAPPSGPLSRAASMAPRIALGVGGMDTLSVAQPIGYADGGLIGDDQAEDDTQVQYRSRLAAQEGQELGADTLRMASGIARQNEALGLESMGYDTQALGYANGGLIGRDPEAEEQEPRNALNGSIVGDLFRDSSGIDAGGIGRSIARDSVGIDADSPVRGLLSESAFGGGRMRGFANGGLLDNPLDDSSLAAGILRASVDRATPAPAPVATGPAAALTGGGRGLVNPPNVVPQAVETPRIAVMPVQESSFRNANLAAAQTQAAAEPRIARMPEMKEQPAASDITDASARNPIAFATFGGGAESSKAYNKDGTTTDLKAGQPLPADVQEFNRISTQVGREAQQPVSVIRGLDATVAMPNPNAAESSGFMREVPTAVFDAGQSQQYFADQAQGARDAVNKTDAQIRVEAAKAAAVNAGRMQAEQLQAETTRRGQDLTDARQREINIITDARQRDLNKIAKENKEAEAIDRKVTNFSKELDKTNTPQFENLLSDIEGTIGKYEKGNIPGFGGTGMLPQFMLSKEGQELRQKIATLQNLSLKDRSGAAVTNQELNRYLNELGTGVFSNDDQLRGGLKNIRNNFNAVKQNVVAGVDDATLQEYMARGGMTLSRGNQQKPNQQPGQQQPSGPAATVPATPANQARVEDLAGKTSAVGKAAARTGDPTNYAPKPGTIEGGYKFKGGNPADPRAWEKA